MPLSLVYMPQVAGSTQEEARRLPLTGDDSRIRVIYTFFQQAGIGQAGKKWFGDRNKNIAAFFTSRLSFSDKHDPLFGGFGLCAEKARGLFPQMAQ